MYAGLRCPKHNQNLNLQNKAALLLQVWDEQYLTARTPEDMVGVATHRLSVAQPGLMITPIPSAHATVAMKRRLLSMPSFIRTCMLSAFCFLRNQWCMSGCIRYSYFVQTSRRCVMHIRTDLQLLLGQHMQSDRNDLMQLDV